MSKPVSSSSNGSDSIPSSTVPTRYVDETYAQAEEYEDWLFNQYKLQHRTEAYYHIVNNSPTRSIDQINAQNKRNLDCLLFFYKVNGCVGAYDDLYYNSPFLIPGEAEKEEPERHYSETIIRVHSKDCIILSYKVKTCFCPRVTTVSYKPWQHQLTDQYVGYYHKKRWARV